MPNNQVIALWGSPGAGTTVTAVKIARELANRKNNVVLVLCDDMTPTVPLIISSSRDKKSLGDLLTMPTINQIAIFQHLVPAGKTLSLLGYQEEENEITYGEYSADRASELISLLRGSAGQVVADYIVIDCFHQPVVNVLTGAALEQADVVLRVTNADPKSLIYLKSQRQYLAEERFHYDQHINILNNILPTQDYNLYENACGGKAYLLPHLDALKTQFDQGCLLESLSGREARQYETVIQTICKEVIIGE